MPPPPPPRGIPAASAPIVRVAPPSADHVMGGEEVSPPPPAASAAQELGTPGAPPAVDSASKVDIIQLQFPTSKLYAITNALATQSDFRVTMFPKEWEEYVT